MPIDVEALVGRRFACDFHVVAITPWKPAQANDDRTVTLFLRSQVYTISVGELRALVDSGLVVERLT